jgi:L-iditol 2-dehydrogenase
VVCVLLELYLKSPNELELREVVPLPAPIQDEVKIKIRYGGICGSDLSVYRGKLAHASYPLRPGHELVGTVQEVGEDATYQVGTRVVVLPNSYCGECEWCQKGRTNICRHKQSIGVNADGGFAQEFVISSKFVLPIPDDLTDERAVLIEPFAVVVHAFKKVRIGQESTVLVVGCGNEGMLAAALALHLGAKVTTTDINPAKLELVKTLGDIRAVSAGEILHETFDVVIEAAGTKSSVEQGIDWVKAGGDIVLIGLTQEATVPVLRVVRGELTLHGTIIYNFPSDFLQTIDYLKDPSFNVGPIVSQILPLSEFESAYDMALSGNYGKIVFDFIKE